ncbi:MAG: hypothetical protein Q7R31_02430, partial [Candidatus Levybacteria bacterium]|nr:hypothetical protein [Candidatus Levybacteria bacterium]
VNQCYVPPTPTPPPPTPTPGPLYMIYGNVFYDTNSSGFPDPGELMYDGTKGNPAYVNITNGPPTGTYSINNNGFYGTLREYVPNTLYTVTLQSIPAGCSTTATNPNPFSMPPSDVTINYPLICGGPTPTPPPTVTIQGHHVDSSGNDLVLAGQKVTVNTVPSSSKTDSPIWFFNTLSPGTYTATADNISGYATSYSLYSCTNSSCPPLTHTTYTSGNSVSNIPLPTGGNYADIFFKYTPSCTAGSTYAINGTVTGQPSGTKLTVCRDPNIPGSCAGAQDSTTTNPSNGTYKLSNISSDTYHFIYLDKSPLSTNYSVNPPNPITIDSGICPTTANFTIGTGPTPTPTPPLGGPTSTPAPTSFPTPTSPPFSSSCNYIDPSTIANSPTVVLAPDGHTLNITYTLSNVSNPTVNFYRNTSPGFLGPTPPPTATLFSTQFGNYGSNFHTGIQYPLSGGGGNYYNYYNYQIAKTSNGSTTYSNPYSVLVQKPNLPPCSPWPYGYNPGTISGANQVSSTDTSITFELSYYVNSFNFWGCNTTCYPSVLPPYLKIQRSSSNTVSYIPFNSYDSPPTSACSIPGWWNPWCKQTTWKVKYTLSLPPNTSDNLTVSGFGTNTTYCGYDTFNGSALPFGAGTQEGQAVTLGTNPTLAAGQAENNVSLSWTPTQDGVDVQGYYIEGPLNRWTLGTQLASPTRSYNPPTWTFTTTDNLNALLPGTYYYGATVYYATVCSGGTVQTDQTAFNWTGKFYEVSGNVFVDANKNKVKDTGEKNYTGAITISSSTGSVAYQGNGNFKVSSLPEGTYTISYTNLPTGYQVSYPVNGPPPSFDVIVGTFCSVGSSNSAACIGQGDIKDLNFGITNLTPWIQSVGLDIRIDSGFNNYIPSTALQPYASTLGSGGTPGIIFSGANSYDLGLGQASPNPYNWIVGGPIFPEIFVPKQTNVIQTSYAYQISTAQQNGLTPTDIDASCSFGIGNCILSLSLPHGLYIANGNLTLSKSGNSGYVFGVNQNYVILVNGDLTINRDITVPNGSTVTFAVSGNIYIDKSVTDIAGYYSADQGFIVLGTNNCSVASDVQLKVEGSVVVNAGQNGGTFQNQRDLCANDAFTPAVQFIERPDFIINSPQLIRFTRPIQKEVAP